MEPESRERALVGLLERARLDKAEIASLADKAARPGYWRDLCPWLSVEQPRDALVRDASLPARETSAHLSRHGYFCVEGAFEPAMIEGMRRCVDVLLQARWPIVFSFVYDQFWQLLRVPALRSFLSAALGPGYRQTAHLWTYYVPAAEGFRGWRPHADTPGGGGRLSLWIPLTDATLRNGCMYLIPNDQRPACLPQNFSRLESLNREELEAVLQAVRAVPACAGSLLGWDHQLVHWGAIATGADGPRMSIAVEFLGDGEAPRAGEEPLMEATALPTLEQRLHLVGKALLDYRRFEPLAGRFVDLGNTLLSKA